MNYEFLGHKCKLIRIIIIVTLFCQTQCRKKTPKVPDSRCVIFTCLQLIQGESIFINVFTAKFTRRLNEVIVIIISSQNDNYIIFLDFGT